MESTSARPLTRSQKRKQKAERARVKAYHSNVTPSVTRATSSDDQGEEVAKQQLQQLSTSTMMMIKHCDDLGDVGSEGGGGARASTPTVLEDEQLLLEGEDTQDWELVDAEEVGINQDSSGSASSRVPGARRWPRLGLWSKASGQKP